VVLVNAPVLAVPLVALAPFQPPDAAQAVAFVVLQVSREELPLAALAGFTPRLTVGAGGVTVTVTVWLADPPGPVQVSV